MLELLDLITPINLREEEEKFIQSSTYHPVFKYRWQNDKDFLAEMVQTNNIQNAFKAAVLSEDNTRIANTCKKVFKVEFDEDTIALANTLTSREVEELTIPYIENVARGFEMAIKFFDLDYKVVIVDKHGFFFRPHHKNKKLYVSKHAQLQFFTIDGVVKHELTHVLRYVNAKHNKILYSKHYLPTEEGLASYMQDHYGLLGQRSLFQHAAEYRASVIGSNGSLRDIYDFFISIGFSTHLAWGRAARHKFGFTDTSKPGDILKPASYFYHEQKIKNMNDEDRWKLFNGKITLEEGLAQEEYRGLIPLEKLKEFYLTSSYGIS